MRAINPKKLKLEPGDFFYLMDSSKPNKKYKVFFCKKILTHKSGDISIGCLEVIKSKSRVSNKEIDSIILFWINVCREVPLVPLVPRGTYYKIYEIFFVLPKWFNLTKLQTND